MSLFQTTMSLLAKATAIKVEQCEAAVATIVFDIGHTISARLASISACSKRHTGIKYSPQYCRKTTLLNQRDNLTNTTSKDGRPEQTATYQVLLLVECICLQSMV